jgi:two-component system sensor histidine kinase PilS (NtrC family)
VLDIFVERQTRTLRGNKILIGLRLLLAVVSLAVLIQEPPAGQDRALGPATPFYLEAPGLTAIIVFGLTILYMLAAARSEQTPSLAPKLAFVQIFVDLFLISALIWHTGGPQSQFVVLYLISICAAAFVLKWNVSILAAACSATLLSTVTLLYSLDVIPEDLRHPIGLQIGHFSLSPSGFARWLLAPVCAFFLTGILAGTLARRLASARLLHDEILEGIGEGILVADAARRVQYHNRELLRMLGLKRNPNGLSVTQLLGEILDKQVAEALAQGAPARTEISHKRDGAIVPILIRITPIHELDEGHARNVILALDDITAEKKIEEFSKHRQRIETMGHISATIAHEIRNPLASIRGAVQEIGRALEIPENKKILLDIVLSESDRLDQIITDFLRFARMRPPKLQQTDLGRVLSDVRLLLLSRPEAKGATITLSGDEGEHFTADPEQLRQLFLNLGVNALQAMDGLDRRELSFHVSSVSLHDAPGFASGDVLERLDRPGVVVEMKDTGKGMPDSVRKQIFEPFFTTKSTGTGLGLAIVERIVQSHEGQITLDSKEGEGTTFWTWLPRDLRPAASFSGHMPAVN